MKINSRLDQIVALLNEHGFLTVAKLSRLCDVSEMTIRRDLELLSKQDRIQRTYGGAVALNNLNRLTEEGTFFSDKKHGVLLVDQVDVLIATSVNPYFDKLMVEKAKKKNIPLIAESIEMPNQQTIVAVDNFKAGFDLGSWAGNYLSQKGIKKAFLLDLTFTKPNTQERSRGFIEGLNHSRPESEVILSINAHSRYATAYQLARDALAVHPQINLIFAINDITAWGAINACRDLNISPDNMSVITFGLEGNTLINELMSPGSFCKAGLGMFPETRHEGRSDAGYLGREDLDGTCASKKAGKLYATGIHQIGVHLVIDKSVDLEDTFTEVFALGHDALLQKVHNFAPISIQDINRNQAQEKTTDPFVLVLAIITAGSCLRAETGCVS